MDTGVDRPNVFLLLSIIRRRIAQHEFNNKQNERQKKGDVRFRMQKREKPWYIVQIIQMTVIFQMQQ